MAPDTRSTERRPVRAIVIDPNMVLRQGLRSLLEKSGRVVVVAEAVDASDAVRVTEAHRPDVVLLDARLPGELDGQTTRRLVALTNVLMVSNVDDHASIGRALRAGATGYLIHGQFTPAELIDAVVGIAAGRHHLSPDAVAALVDMLRSSPAPREDAAKAEQAHGLSQRETEIIEHIVRGHSNAEIAAILLLSEKTVKNHINHIYAKLGARHRAEAIARWLGLAPSPAAEPPYGGSARRDSSGPPAGSIRAARPAHALISTSPATPAAVGARPTILAPIAVLGRLSTAQRAVIASTARR